MRKPVPAEPLTARELSALSKADQAIDRIIGQILVRWEHGYVNDHVIKLLTDARKGIRTYKAMYD